MLFFSFIFIFFFYCSVWFFKQKTAYEMRFSDWSSDVCSSDLPAYLDKGENRSITPELKINENPPPVFLFATADDTHGNSTLVMAGALRDAKVPVEQHLYTEGGHGYGLRPGNPAAEAWPELARKWLNALISPAEADQ